MKYYFFKILEEERKNLFFWVSIFVVSIFLIFWIKIYHKEQYLFNKFEKNVIINGQILDIKQGRKFILFSVKVNNSNFFDFQEKNLKFIVFNNQFRDLKKINNSNLGDVIDLIADFRPENRENIPFYWQFFNIFAFGKVVKIEKIIHKNKFAFGSFFDKIRRKVQTDIFEIGNKSSGSGVVIAILTGNTSFIHKKELEFVRKAGCAHILAISGLHMSTIMMFVFFIFRTFLSLFPYIYLRWNIVKIAYIPAILVCFLYLQISGSPISAVRSFIMLIFVLFTILIERNKISLRILFLTAILMLIFHPDYIFWPSFQMSFIAVLALMSSYSGFIGRILKIDNNERQKRKFLYYFFGILFSSAVASMATTPFGIYHFNTFSVVGLLSNVTIVPLTEFFVLPIAFIGLIFHGTYFSTLCYKLTSLIADSIIVVSEWSIKLKYSYFETHLMSSINLIVCTIFLFMFFLGTKYVKILSIIPLLIGIIIFNI